MGKRTIDIINSQAEQQEERKLGVGKSVEDLQEIAKEQIQSLSFTSNHLTAPKSQAKVVMGGPSANESPDHTVMTASNNAGVTNAEAKVESSQDVSDFTVNPPPVPAAARETSRSALTHMTNEINKELPAIEESSESKIVLEVIDITPRNDRETGGITEKSK